MQHNCTISTSILIVLFYSKLDIYLYKEIHVVFFFREGCPIQPGSSLQKIMYLTPTLESNKDRRGIALDGKLKSENTNLASSTL